MKKISVVAGESNSGPLAVSGVVRFMLGEVNGVKRSEVSL